MKNYTHIALLTGGGDRPYALGIANALSEGGCYIDFIGSDELKSTDLDSDPSINFLNLRGDQDSSVPSLAKASRLLKYYFRLLKFTFTSKAKIFHILWNNKIQLIDRVPLMLLYRIRGKAVFLTVHNVNIGKRDGTDSYLNRISLKIQYRLCKGLFVHTTKMKDELITEFGIEPSKIKQIPFGINSTVPKTALSLRESRLKLGLSERNKVILFFGNILAYKGLEYLVRAFFDLAREDPEYRLVIAGRSKGDRNYWKSIEREINESGFSERVVTRIEFVPDEDTEIFFKAADVLALPYTSIFQSGVLFLSYNFGLPVVATDVGSLAEDVSIGQTGFVSQPKSSIDLAKTLRQFFDSELYLNLDSRRSQIVEYAKDKYSWQKVSKITLAAYGAN